MLELHRGALLLAAFLCCQLPLGQAQEPDILETVLVTATGTPRAGASLDLGWSLLEEGEIQSISATHINELFNRISGAWISRGNGQEHLSSLRSPVLTGAGGCGSIFMAQDGISLRAPGFCNVNQLFDASSELAERIEVLKGPGTALYGSNAMHGVINVLSPRPGHNTPGEVRLELGPHDYQRLRLNDTWRGDSQALRVSLMANRDGGYKEDSGFDQQKINLSHSHETNILTVNTILSASNLNQETAGFISGEDAYENSNLKKLNPNPEAFRDASSLRLQSRIAIAMKDGDELLLVPYLRDNDMRFVQHFLPWKAIEENEHSSVGLRASIKEDVSWGTLTYGLDVEYTDAGLKETQSQNFSPAQPAGAHYDYNVDAKTTAVYTQLSRRLGNRATLEAGLRYESNQYDYKNRLPDGSACDTTVTNCRFFRPGDRKDTFDETSFNASLGYQIHENHRSYIRFATGHRAPQASELYRLQQGQERAKLNSEQLKSIEVGLSGFLGNIEYRLDAWKMNKTDVVFQNADRQNLSGGRTSHQGMDLSLDYPISQNLDVSIVYSNALHRYSNNIDLFGARFELEGNAIDTAPRHMGSARLSWQIRSSTTAELEWVHMGEYFTDPDNQHSYPGHDLLNLRTYVQVSENTTLGVRIHNLLDEDYAERADFGFGNERYFVGEPRSIYVDLRYRWGVSG